MAKRSKKQKKQPHPFQKLLEYFPGERLTSLKHYARHAEVEAEDHDPAEFQHKLARKLENSKYEPPNYSSADVENDSRSQSFAKILQNAGVMRVLLSPALTKDIERWIALQSVFIKDKKARDERKSVKDLPIKFHKSMFTELRRHRRAVEKLAMTYRAPEGEIESYTGDVFREQVRQFSILQAFYVRQEWRILLSLRHQKFRSRKPEVLISVAIFRLLRGRLQNGKSKQQGISDQFLRDLTLLITDSKKSAEALRQAVNKRK
jgi:hypothetical protein